MSVIEILQQLPALVPLGCAFADRRVDQCRGPAGGPALRSLCEGRGGSAVTAIRLQIPALSLQKREGQGQATPQTRLTTKGRATRRSRDSFLEETA